MKELVNCQMDFHGMVTRGFMPTPPEKKRDSSYKFHRQLKRQVGRLDVAPAIKPWVRPLGIKPAQPYLWREKVEVLHTYKKVTLSGSDNGEYKSLEDALRIIWAYLSFKDVSLSPPRLNKMQDAKPALINMLSSLKITIADFEKTLQLIQHRYPWAKSFLHSPTIQSYLKEQTTPVHTYKYTLSGYLLEHIQTNISQPTAAAPIDPEVRIASIRKQYIEKKFTPEKTDNAIQKHRLLARLPSGQYPAAKNPQGHALEPRPAATKNIWYHNRINKGRENHFTLIQVETPDGKQLFTAELVNTVPDEALRANGWTADAINGMKLRSKSRPMSPAALKALGCNSAAFDFQGRYYGEGAYGKVKPALITLPGSARKVWCVAKKVKINTEREFNDVLKETRLQANSGVGPKIHGIADSINKRGQRQSIIFMEKLEGVEGDKFLKGKKHSMTFSNKIKLAENLIHQVMSMHRNQVFHGDMKWLNSGVDPKTLNVQLLDFGLGSVSQHQYQTTKYVKGPGYCPPEWVQGRKNRRGYLDMEKVDVYSLGVMLGELFGSDRFMFHTWSSSNLHNPQAQINRDLHCSGINDRRLYALIERMVQADPDKRPTMQEVEEQFSLMRASLIFQ